MRWIDMANIDKYFDGLFFSPWPANHGSEGFAGIQPFYFITLFTLVHCL